MKKYFAIILTLAIVFACSACGNNAQIDQLNAQIQDLEDQLNESNKTIQVLQGKLTESDKTIQDLNKQIEALSKVDAKQNSSQGVQTDTTTSSKKQSTSDIQLGTTESEIFELLKKSLYHFPNPASVRVVKFHAYQEREETFYLTLTSENSFGGSLTDLYELSEDGAYGSGYSEDQLERMWNALRLTSPACDVSQINFALEEYCQNLGLSQSGVAEVEPKESADPDYMFSDTGSTSGGGTFKKYNFG